MCTSCTEVKQKSAGMYLNSFKRKMMRTITSLYLSVCEWIAKLKPVVRAVVRPKTKSLQSSSGPPHLERCTLRIACKISSQGCGRSTPGASQESFDKAPSILGLCCKREWRSHKLSRSALRRRTRVCSDTKDSCTLDCRCMACIRGAHRVAILS